MKKINLFDGLILLLVAGILVLSFLIAKQPARDFGAPAELTVRIGPDAVQNISQEIEKKGPVYLNGQNEVSQISSVKTDPKGLEVTIEGLGKSENGAYQFNGQRVLIGQKVELHGGFWAQGNVTHFSLK